MKTKEEVKTALKICSHNAACADCPYNEPGSSYDECMTALIRDAADLVDLLEEEQDEEELAWERVDCVGDLCRSFRCPKCGGVVEPGYYTHLCDYEFCPYCGKKLEEIGDVKDPF